jgi:hypothetical protein
LLCKQCGDPELAMTVAEDNDKRLDIRCASCGCCRSLSLVGKQRCDSVYRAMASEVQPLPDTMLLNNNNNSNDIDKEYKKRMVGGALLVDMSDLNSMLDRLDDETHRQHRNNDKNQDNSSESNDNDDNNDLDDNNDDDDDDDGDWWTGPKDDR